MEKYHLISDISNPEIDIVHIFLIEQTIERLYLLSEGLV